MRSMTVLCTRVHVRSCVAVLPHWEQVYAVRMLKFLHFVGVRQWLSYFVKVLGWYLVGTWLQLVITWSFRVVVS